jgi:lipooligosaccharide transport system permease protein
MSLYQEPKMTWQGARNIVNLNKALTWGPWFVAEYRLRNMSKWIGAIIAFGLGNPVLYLLSVGIGIGALVNAQQGPNGVDGVSYLAFLAPALLATSAIQAAMDETSFPTLQGFVWDKSFFSMNATQLRGGDIVGGIMIASFARCLFNTLVYALVLWAFGAITPDTIPVLLVSAIFAGLAFASAMLAATSFVKQDDGFFALVGRFIIAPMFMFSGTFYPLENLPIYLQWIGWVSPVWHATDIGRALSYGHSVSGWLMTIHFAYLAAMLVGGLYIGTRQFNRRLAK